jgi:branched-chain amino acid transport system substrate-binding protein
MRPPRRAKTTSREKAGEILFKLGQTDFQPELSEIRAKRPESIMIFAPAAMGVAFMKQWRALELSKQMRLYALNAAITSLPAW